MIQQGKRGQEKMIAMLIIMAIGFVLVAAIIFRIGEVAHEEAGPQACLGALSAQNWIIERLGEGSAAAKPWPRACRTQDKTIEGETAPQASQEIIRLLGDCWYQMGSGRFSPFAINLALPGKKCFICYTFRAPDLHEPITDVQFNSYLKEISHPGSDESLYEIFNKDLSTYDVTLARDVENIPLLSEAITQEDFYSVIFLDIEEDAFIRSITQRRIEGRRGLSKLLITPVEQARECFGERSVDVVETGD